MSNWKTKTCTVPGTDNTYVCSTLHLLPYLAFQVVTEYQKGIPPSRQKAFVSVISTDNDGNYTETLRDDGDVAFASVEEAQQAAEEKIRGEFLLALACVDVGTRHPQAPAEKPLPSMQLTQAALYFMGPTSSEFMGEGGRLEYLMATAWEKAELFIAAARRDK